MKKLLLIIVIFSLLAISFTYTMITIKNNNITILENADINNLSNENSFKIDNVSKEESTIMNSREEIILGESTYFENPINFIYYMNDGTVTDELYSANYIQIEKLKNKDVETKINNRLKNNKIELVLGSFSNVVSMYSFVDGYQCYNYNLIDGEELTIEDYIDDKQNIKNVLPKYFYKAISEKFMLASYIYEAFEDDYDEKYFEENELYRDLKYTEEEKESYIKKQNKSKELYAKFYEQIESWQMELLKKYDTNQFDFYFTSNKLYLIFKNCNFINPIDESSLEYSGGYKEEINEIVVAIPLCEIYKNVIIFNKYSENRDIFENNIVEEKYIGLEELEKISDNILSFDTGDINKINIDTFIGFAGDFDELKKANEKWNDKYKKISQYDTKKIICFNKQCASSMYGSFLIQYYLLYDKDVSQKEEQEILAKIMKGFDVVYDYQLKESLEDISKELKATYNNIEYDVEEISLLSKRYINHNLQKNLTIKNKYFLPGDIEKYYIDISTRKNELNTEEQKEFEFFEKYVSKDEIYGDGIFSGLYSTYNTESTLKESNRDFNINNLNNIYYDNCWVEGEKGSGIATEFEITTFDTCDKVEWNLESGLSMDKQEDVIKYLLNNYNSDPAGPKDETEYIYESNIDEYKNTISKIVVINGYAKSEELWRNNNRIKMLKLIIDDNYEYEMHLEDTRDIQVFDINYTNETIRKPIKIRAIIYDVYKGEKYDDTCLTSFKLYGGSNVNWGGR